MITNSQSEEWLYFIIFFSSEYINFFYDKICITIKYSSYFEKFVTFSLSFRSINDNWFSFSRFLTPFRVSMHLPVMYTCLCARVWKGKQAYDTVLCSRYLIIRHPLIDLTLRKWYILIRVHSVHSLSLSWIHYTQVVRVS